MTSLGIIHPFKPLSPMADWRNLASCEDLFLHTGVHYRHYWAPLFWHDRLGRSVVPVCIAHEEL